MVKHSMFHKTRLLIALLMTALLPSAAMAALAGASNQGFQGTGQFTGDASGGGGMAPTASQVAAATSGGGGGGGGGSGKAGGTQSPTGTPSQQGNANAVSSILHPDATAKSAQAAINLGPFEPMDNEAVRDKLMDNSINAYPGRCACPYSRNSDGYECGVEAAYYKPGGYRIYCYPEDVRKQLNIYYRKTH